GKWYGDLRIFSEGLRERALVDAEDLADGGFWPQDHLLGHAVICDAGEIAIGDAALLGVEPEIGTDDSVGAEGNVELGAVGEDDADEHGLGIAVGNFEGLGVE